MDEVLIRFRLVGDEAKRFKALSAQEMRKPTQQARYLVRCALEAHGLLPDDHDHVPEAQHAQRSDC